MSQFSALLSCKDAVFNKNQGKLGNDGPNQEIEGVEKKDYTAYHAVSETGPRVGDVIAFQVIEMADNYAPEVSDYKEGKVLECDGKKLVTFELIKLSSKRKNGKFEMDDQENQGDKVVSYNW